MRHGPHNQLWSPTARCGPPISLLPGHRPTRFFRVVAKSALLFPLLLLVASCSGASSGPGSFGSGFVKVPATPQIQALEHQMAERLNRDRAANGLPALEYDETLADIARAHSADMHNSGFFAHQSPTTGMVDDRLAAAGYLALEARENLAEGPDVDTAEDGLLDSPGHYANIMSDTVTHLGIGIVEGGVEDERNLLFTQVFTKPGKRESPTQARQNITALIAQTRRDAGLPPVSEHRQLDQLADKHIDSLPDRPSAASLKKVGKVIATELAKKPIEGIQGVSVGGQLLWQSDQYEPSPALTQTDVRHYGMALREVKDEKGRPQLKLLVLFGI
jgi:uncharacterized protein YkwD